MKCQFMKDHSGEFPVKKMAKVLEVSRSRYYFWLNNPFIKTKKDHELTEKIVKIYEDNKKAYGSPRIHAELKESGISCGHNRVAKIMHKKGLKARIKKKYKVTTDSNHAYPVAPNLVNRNFLVNEPNKIWVSDLTYVWTQEGWLYLCAIIDLFARKVIGYSMSENIDTTLVSDAFHMAIFSRDPRAGLIFHSDRGVQYASHEFRKLLKDNHVIQSMSRKGNCWDNACAESFFSTLKIEEIFQRNYRTRFEARMSIFNYIVGFYNRRRKHSVLDYMSPENYECNWLKKIA
jgi:putative transposase